MIFINNSINKNLLIAIAITESRLNQQAINYNKNSKKNLYSIDYGLMQINSWWFDFFKKRGIASKTIKDDPCVNIFVGAYILNHNFNLRVCPNMI